MFVKRTLASASVSTLRLIVLEQPFWQAHLGQVGKVLGDRWKALSEKQRQPYEAKAQADKKRYEDEKAKYNVSRLPHSSARAYTNMSQAGDADEESE
jgi:hypothetical protein